MRACSLSAVCVCVAVLIGSSGCGGPAMATVRGKVTCKGKAVAQAHLIFSPVPRSPEDREPGKPATGFTDDNGEYTLSTFKAYDGALVGPHEVTISLDETNPARCARMKKVNFEVKRGDNEINIELSDQP
jgi:hypothetical protein